MERTPRPSNGSLTVIQSPHKFNYYNFHTCHPLFKNQISPLLVQYHPSLTGRIHVLVISFTTRAWFLKQTGIVTISSSDFAAGLSASIMTSINSTKSGAAFKTKK